MSRRMVIIVVALFASASLSFALPSVAILQTIVAAGIDPTVNAAVTAKTEEAFVNSGRFQVLDRVNVMQVLKEKEFQLSTGLVSEAEMRQAGEYLGADFVVVANVSRLGQTYMISIKMVNVTTGKIEGQASGEKQGTVDVLFSLASEVAGKISGMQITSAGTVPAAPKETVPQQPKTPSKSWALDAQLGAIFGENFGGEGDIVFRFFLGSQLSLGGGILLGVGDGFGFGIHAILGYHFIPEFGIGVSFKGLPSYINAFGGPAITIYVFNVMISAAINVLGMGGGIVDVGYSFSF